MKTTKTKNSENRSNMRKAGGEAAKRIRVSLELLNHQIATLQEAFVQDCMDWSHVGSLNHIAEQLESLTGQRG